MLKMKPFLFLFVIFIGSLAIVAVLFIYSGNNQKPKNGFSRKLEKNGVKKIAELDVKYNTFYISGISKDRIYLGNYKSPLYLFDCNHSLEDTVLKRLPFSYSSKVKWGIAKLQVDSPNLYLSEFLTPTLILAKLPFKEGQALNTKALRFDDIKFISPNSAIIRTYDLRLKQKVIQKVINGRSQTVEKAFRPHTQQDGSFSIDGFFNLDKSAGKIYYTYYYRNQFICLDTNLNVLYQANTIDTNTLAKIKLKSIEKGGSKITSHVKPPLYVNKRGYAHRGLLYVNSALASDAESKMQFSKYSVIDVYEERNGRYIKSFTLPNYAGVKISDFAVFEGKLFAVYDRYLLVYRLAIDK